MSRFCVDLGQNTSIYVVPDVCILCLNAKIRQDAGAGPGDEYVGRPRTRGICSDQLSDTKLSSA